MSSTVIHHPETTPGNPWSSPFLVALLLHALLVFGGIFGSYDLVQSLVNAGESVEMSSAVVQERTPWITTEVDLVPPPPEEPNPEFVQPVEVAEEKPLPVEFPPEEEIPPVVEETPVVETAPPEPAQPTPVVAENQPPSPESTPVSTVATSPVRESAHSSADDVVLGNKGFPIPPYPTEARIRRYKGVVVLSIQILNGHIQEVSVASSSGYRILDATASGFIRKNWKFPEGVNRIIVQPIRYDLSG